MTAQDDLKQYIEQFYSLTPWDAFRAGLETAAQVVESYEQAYPTDVFPEPPKGQHGISVDACSASALRHVLSNVTKDIRKLAE